MENTYVSHQFNNDDFSNLLNAFNKIIQFNYYTN